MIEYITINSNTCSLQGLSLKLRKYNKLNRGILYRKVKSDKRLQRYFTADKHIALFTCGSFLRHTDVDVDAAHSDRDGHAGNAAGGGYRLD